MKNKIVFFLQKKVSKIILFLLGFFRVLLFFSLDYNFTPDSYEYIARDGFVFLNGIVDRYRLPLYPLLIDLFQLFSGENAFALLCFIQLFFSVLSIYYFYKLSIKLFEGIVPIFFTVIFGTLSSLSGWDKTILTESLSLSLAVFIVYNIVSFILEKKDYYIIFSILFISIGCFLRAVFAIYAGLIFGFLILYFLLDKTKKHKKQIGLVLFSTFPIIMMLIYASIFMEQYGAFTVSDSELGQQLMIVLKNRYYSGSSDTELVKVSDEIINTIAKSKVKNEIDFLVDKIGIIDKKYYEYYIYNEIEKKEPGIILNQKYEKELDSFFSYLYNNYDCSFTDSYYLARCFIMNNYDRARISNFVNESKKMNIIPIVFSSLSNNIKGYYESYYLVKDSKLAIMIHGVLKSMFFFINISILHTIVFSFCSLFIFIYDFDKYKNINWIQLGFFAFSFSTILLSIFGTNDEFARTSITALPVTLLSIASLVCYITKMKMLFQHNNLTIKTEKK